MKYIKPPDFQSVKEFQEFYRKIETDITKLLTADGSARTANELQAKLSQAIEAATVYLARKNENFVRDELPKAFEEGKDSAKGTTKVSAKEASEILEKQGFKYAKNAFKRDTYIELQTAVKSAENGLKTRVNDIIKDLHKNGKDTIYNVQQAILKDLQNNGVLAVEYANGAKQTLSSYAAMAARSARIESMNIGAIGRALQLGTDYVKMTFMPQCCKVCGAYQDKVYCISGKDKRFPALFKTVLRSGYALPHPNCRHEFIPWFLEMESAEDIQKAIKNSKIKYDSKGDLIDVRYQKDIKAYAAWQAGNRQLNTEYKEFLQMQSHFQKKNKPAPYSTLGGFKRARRSDNLSPAFKAWRYRNVDAKQYESWKTILGEENMPKDVDSFQDIKYNKNTETYSLLRHYKSSVEKGDVAALSGFNNYKQQYIKIKKLIVGKSFDNIEIKSVSYHFIDRTVGSIYYTYSKNEQPIKHEGVSVENTLKILTEGKARKIVVDKLGRASQKYILKGVGNVSINPVKGELIQVNKNE